MLTLKGGGWEYQDFQQWMNQRRTLECSSNALERLSADRRSHDVNAKLDLPHFGATSNGASPPCVFLPQMYPAGLNELQIAQLLRQNSGRLHPSISDGANLDRIDEMMRASNINAATFPSGAANPGN
jgi:hypothetical protein